EVRVRPSGPFAEVVVVRVGDVLAVELSENATTGYVWTVQDVPDELVALPDEVPGDLTSLRAGAALGRVLRFGAGRPGTAHLVLRHARAWEDAPLDVLTVPVRVEPAG
ncbi:MAG TPA: protease inhibitor I42 family protein, partial [Kineosporiaceae bacterium]|nr:protease inhibitor I42 family protein [Kineosporiaceae bacterium]